MDLCECLYPGRFWEAMDPYCMAVASVVIDGTSNVYFVHQTGPYMDFALACSWATGYPPTPASHLRLETYVIFRIIVIKRFTQFGCPKG